MGHKIMRYHRRKQSRDNIRRFRVSLENTWKHNPKTWHTRPFGRRETSRVNRAYKYHQNEKLQYQPGRYGMPLARKKSYMENHGGYDLYDRDWF